jgi:hypothetical protein
LWLRLASWQEILRPQDTGELGEFAILLARHFLPAGTLNYWQAWGFAVSFAVSSQALGIYVLMHDESSWSVSALFALGFIAFAVLPALDHRFGWSPVVPAMSLVGDAIIVLSFVLFSFVMKSNSYAASTI